MNEIGSVLNFERGIFYTIREMFLRPGATTRKFIAGDRDTIVKPILFLIICSLVYSAGQHFLNYETGYIRFDTKDQVNTPIVVDIFEWFSQNYGYANILMTIIIALWIRVFFRMYTYNYYEIFVLLCYVMGVSVLIYSLLGVFENIIDMSVLHVGKFVVFVYSSWAIGQFFDGSKKMNYLKGFLSYLLLLHIVTLLLFSPKGLPAYVFCLICRHGETQKPNGK